LCGGGLHNGKWRWYQGGDFFVCVRCGCVVHSPWGAADNEVLTGQTAQMFLERRGSIQALLLEKPK
jgi:hypothetical protein